MAGAAAAVRAAVQWRQRPLLAGALAAAAAAQPSCVRRVSSGVFTLCRAFSQQDVDAFVALTGDSNPIHSQAAAGSGGSAARAPILPGMLLASLFPALIGSAFPGALYASQSLKFRRQAAVGEPVTAVVSVASASGSRVAFDTVCRDAAGNVLLDGTALALIRPAAAAAALG